MNKIIFIFIVTLNLPAVAQICQWAPKNILKKVSASEQYIIFDVPNDPILWSFQEPVSQNITEFRQLIEKSINSDQNFLRQKQISLYKSLFGENDSLVKYLQMVLNGVYGEDTSPHCLDLLLLDKHFQFSKYDQPTEFGTYILSKKIGTKNVLRFLFQSFNSPSVPPNKRLDSDLKKYIKEGWVMLGHMHAHPFILDNPTGDIGGTTWASSEPTSSSGDLYIYNKGLKNYGLQNAWVTNGFTTFHLKAVEFEQIKKDFE